MRVRIEEKRFVSFFFVTLFFFFFFFHLLASSRRLCCGCRCRPNHRQSELRPVAARLIPFFLSSGFSKTLQHMALAWRGAFA